MTSPKAYNIPITRSQNTEITERPAKEFYHLLWNIINDFKEDSKKQINEARKSIQELDKKIINVDDKISKEILKK